MGKSSAINERSWRFSQMRYVFCYLLFLLVFLCDRTTKWFMIATQSFFTAITSFLSFDLHFNRGISWGMLHTENDIMFIVVSLSVACITTIVAFFAYHQFLRQNSVVGHTLVITGSLSNLLDRIMYGGVIDFIHFHYKSYSFPVFNIADIAIVLGVMIMVVQELMSDNKS